MTLKLVDTIGAGGIRTPSFVAAEMRTVDQTINALGVDIQRVADQLPAGFMNGWIAFRVEWQRFLADNSSWLDRATNTVYDKTIEFRERAASWRDKFVREGGRPSTPALPQGRTWPVGAIVAGAAIVGLTLWYLFKVDHK